MPRKVYSQEFKESAIRLARQEGSSVAATAKELGISDWTLRKWVKEAGRDPVERQSEADMATRVRQLEAELRRVRMERDILKKATAYFASLDGGSQP